MLPIQKMEENKLTEFNEAGYKMRRIDKLQDIMNMASVNPLSFFVGKEEYNLLFTGLRNYEVKFRCMEQLFMEIYSKCSKDEIGVIQNIRSAIREFIRTHPVFERDIGLNGKIKENLILSNWIVVERKLTELEERIRLLHDKHGFGGEEKRDPRTAVTN